MCRSGGGAAGEEQDCVRPCGCLSALKSVFLASYFCFGFPGGHTVKPLSSPAAMYNGTASAICVVYVLGGIQIRSSIFFYTLFYSCVLSILFSQRHRDGERAGCLEGRGARACCSGESPPLARLGWLVDVVHLSLKLVLRQPQQQLPVAAPALLLPFCFATPA